MSKWVSAAMLTTSLLFASAAFAGPDFDAVDTNKDGMLSKAEAAVVKGLDFTDADLDKDGMLDRAEYEAVMN